MFNYLLVNKFSLPLSLSIHINGVCILFPISLDKGLFLWCPFPIQYSSFKHTIPYICLILKEHTYNSLPTSSCIFGYELDITFLPFCLPHTIFVLHQASITWRNASLSLSHQTYQNQLLYCSTPTNYYPIFYFHTSSLQFITTF